MGFPRQEYWIVLPFPSPRDLPGPGMEASSPALQADSMPQSLQGSPTPIFFFILAVEDNININTMSVLKD